MCLCPANIDSEFTLWRHLKYDLLRHEVNLNWYQTALIKNLIVFTEQTHVLLYPVIKNEGGVHHKGTFHIDLYLVANQNIMHLYAEPQQEAWH